MIDWARLEVIYDFNAGVGETDSFSFADPSSAPKATHYVIKGINYGRQGCRAQR